MKRILALTLSLASITFGAVAANAATTPSSTIAATGIAPQIRIRIGREPRRRYGYYRAPVEVTTQTRIVRDGWRMYRETYQVRYLPNGMTRTRLISRVRIR
ncbi:MAG TPA: acid shock protein [Pyrinomonadaceae bacterium]|nr:acid shock protein [Pyrinomonadaceae bacterium]